MGLLQWLRGDADGPSSTVGAAALMELDANLSPAKRQQIENLETLESLREEEGTGAKGDRRDIDLESGVATIRVPRTAS
ncbi:MAG: hypothetical protein HOQ05_02800 [Corynebacteriales bacterium]|nr:hypothetical protein [Mycobacteriales bacterium]